MSSDVPTVPACERLKVKDLGSSTAATPATYFDLPANAVVKLSAQPQFRDFFPSPGNFTRQNERSPYRQAAPKKKNINTSRIILFCTLIIGRFTQVLWRVEGSACCPYLMDPVKPFRVEDLQRTLQRAPVSREGEQGSLGAG